MITEIFYYCRKSSTQERRVGYVVGGRNYSVLVVSGIPFSLPPMRMRKRLKRSIRSFQIMPKYTGVSSSTCLIIWQYSFNTLKGAIPLCIVNYLLY